MKVIVNGAAGFMGREVLSIVEKGARGAELAFAADREGTGYMPISTFDGAADIIIDFSHHSATTELCEYAVKRNLPVILCTTGQTDDELAAIDIAAKKVPVFRSGNMSVGIALLVELAKKTAAAMPDADIEIIESH
ncbi:MAG: 4-hydroxy-tetrahydrodipicolinate reductase, partial [Ruminococcaceae bacterium]|nr:4-hydroxy-tetrahydrodipicolinate reductase [Oscillospiraceae bacterium]